MIHHNSLRPLATLSIALLALGAAQAATYSTQITGTDNATEFELNYLEVVWSTSATFGSAVDETALSDLSISIYDNSNALVYNDVVISGGIVQSIGGLSRNLSDISFSATSGSAVLNFDNDLNQIQLGSASGTTFNIYGDTSVSLNLAYYLEGILQEDATLLNLTQNTTAVPEPSGCAALAGLICAGFAFTRRRLA